MGNAKEHKRQTDEVDTWRMQEGLPAVPMELQSLPAEQIKKLLMLYQKFLRNPDLRDSVERDTRRLEFARWLVQHNLLREFGVGYQGEDWNKLLFQDSTPKPSRPILNSQLSMRGKRR